MTHHNKTRDAPQYFPDKEIGYYWLTVCSVAAGGFGVVAGGYITDRLQSRCRTRVTIHTCLYTHMCHYIYTCVSIHTCL